MHYSSPSRRLQALPIARSSRAVLACAVTAGLSFPLAIQPSQAEEAVTAEAFLANLVNEVTTSKNAVNDFELEMGGLREGANKARVDLDHARQDAQEAQNNVVDARGRLDQSDEAVEDAQKDLDEIARSAYNSGGDASPVTLAAGSDAVADTLDRSTYIRLATERQQNTVNQLDLARTQTANEEAALRNGRDAANSAVSEAIRLHNQAREALSNAQVQLRDKTAEYHRLVKDRDLAQKRLDAARSAVDTLSNKDPQASSFEKRRVAEAAANKAEGLTNEVTAKGEQKNDAESASDAPQGTDSTPTASTAPDASAPDAEEAKDTEAPAAAGPSTPTTDYAGDASALPEITGNTADFNQSSAGDQQRQLAINGLVAAGGAAAMAGFNSYAQDGDQTNAVNAAISAGRQSAGEQYDQAQATLNPQQDTPTTPEVDPTSPIDSGDLGDLGEDVDTPTTPSIPSLPSVPGTADSDVDTSGTASEQIERVIERGMSQLGVTYAWGGGNQYGPTLGIRDGGVADTYGDYAKIGFDCSGLTLYAFAAVGIQLDHYSGSQYNAGRQVPTSEMKRGDLLFWGAGGSQHVSIYLGDGTMLEAPQSGSSVRVSPVRYGGMTPMAVRLIE